MNLTCGHIYEYYCAWITPPHNKYALCVCNINIWFFWFNTNARFHRQGQISIPNGEHSFITHDCFLDLSTIKTATPAELAGATDHGVISHSLRTRIRLALGVQIGTLPDNQRIAARANL